MPSNPTARARRLRRRSTYTESLLWALLRDRRLGDLKFRRQVPVGPYVVDFACLERRLVIELDGGVHDAPFYDTVADAEREAWLTGQDFRLLRVRNAEVENTPHRVIDRILSQVGPRVPSPPAGEGVAGGDG